MARGAHGPAGGSRGRDGDDGLASIAGGSPIRVPDIQDVIGFDALYESMLKCRREVMWKASVANFCLNGAESVARLCHELECGTYKPRPVREFKVYAPKERDIVGISFRDRVYQRSLCDNLVYPILSKSWIYDNMACQKGKGTDRARDRFECFMQRSYRKHDIIGGVLCIDVHGYYPLMWHDVAENVYRSSEIPEWGQDMVIDILRNQYEGDRGYNPGSQVMQITGVSVLSPLDHFIKEKLHIKGYTRYMDDMRIIHHDYEYLRYCKDQIEAKLAELGFEFNEKKTRIHLLTEPVPYLGFTYRLTGSGKVVRTPITSTTRRAQRRIAKLVAMEVRGKRPYGTSDTSYVALRNYVVKADSYWRLERLDEWYTDIWNREMSKVA